MDTIQVKELPGRTVVSTGRIWEDKVGYSRAVKIGNTIAVTGTMGINPDGSYDESAGEQMRMALKTALAAAEALGAGVEHVIRTRIFVTEIADWQEIGAVHSEFFGEVKPATTMVEISRLVDERAVLEVEIDAILS